MRTLIVVVMTFICITLLLWFCFGFISAVWNPMAWEAVARFFFVCVVLFFGCFGSLFAGACYDEHIKELERNA